MQSLRRFINLVLTETAKGLNELPDDFYVLIARRGGGVKVELRTTEDARSIGQILMKGPADNCAGAYTVASSFARGGWGPFLYDIAMEWAALYGNGLTPDRLTVSSDAQRVWNFYLKNRPDVTAHQLDDSNNTLTPMDDDNCQQDSATNDAFSHAPRDQVAGNKRAFTLSALSKRYTKEPTTINALKRARRLRVEDF